MGVVDARTPTQIHVGVSDTSTFWPCDLYLKFGRLYTSSAPLSLTIRVFFTVRRPRSARGLGPAALWSSQRFARSSTDFKGRVGPRERERRGGREIRKGARGREIWKKKGRAEPRWEEAREREREGEGGRMDTLTFHWVAAALLHWFVLYTKGR